MGETAYGDECITTLIPRAIPEKVKPPMYISKYRDQVREQSTNNRVANATMGPAKVQVPTPMNYLKKDTRRDKYDNQCSTSHVKKDARKPAVPKTQNKVGRPTNKDFIRTNAIENITSVPRKPKAKYVDSNTGHSNDLVTSGMVPNYILKPDLEQFPNTFKRKTAKSETHKKNTMSTWLKGYEKVLWIKSQTDNVKAF